MTNTNIKKLLGLILNESPLEYLTRNGLDYSQIFELISEAIDLGFLSYEEDLLVLTDKGVEFISIGKISSKPSEWILPEDYSRIEKIDPEEIFLPKKSTIQNLLK
ncbi:hypothetical protein [Maridesulfovibrio sp.]|uniref:hypothetical protein n=1 Tax=Maridesulfovibrio sp. TaxID=2795000 RepID=UPI0029C9B60A|nr:hypothetical protein [Maridesulfovibrio sp.]